MMHAMRIATIRKSDGHRAETGIEVIDMAPDRDIVGRSADAIMKLVEADDTLRGQQPHLHNAVIGLFATASHQVTVRGVETLRSKINWTPVHDLEIIIGEDA